MERKTGLLSILFATALTSNVFAANDEIVFVQTDCSSVSSGQRCFNTMPDLQDWLWNVRKPSATSRVAVHIGPGDFLDRPTGAVVFDCSDGNGYVSLIGSGPQTTRLLGHGNALIAKNCTDLHVQDMTLETTGSYAIRWQGGGSSRWVNVDVKGNWFAWTDDGIVCDSVNPPIHYWFNSRLQHNGTGGATATYNTACGESWFYASELTYQMRDTISGSIVSVNGNAEVRLFGSVMRAVLPVGANPGIPPRDAFITGAKATGDGDFHMHGGIISLDVSQLAGNVGVSGLENEGSGTMHTPETAFTLKAAGTGEAWRISKTGSGPVLSPYTWPAGTTPPSLATNGTLNGSDTFIETDCDSSGDCSGNSSNPQHPHLMVYDDTCTGAGGAWYDMATNQCRQ